MKVTHFTFKCTQTHWTSQWIKAECLCNPMYVKATPTTDVKRINVVNFSSLCQDFDKTFDLFSFNLSDCAQFPLRRAALQTAKQPIFQAAPWQRGFKPHPQPAKQVTDCLLEVKHFPVKWAKSGLSVTACPKTCDPHLNSFQHDISLNQGHRSSYCALSMCLMSIKRNRRSADGPFFARKKHPENQVHTKKLHLSSSTHPAL